MATELSKFLKAVPIFAEMAPAELAIIESLGQLRTYPRNAMLLTEGDDAGSLFVVLDGMVKVFLSDENGREVILGYEEAGGYFGEISLLDSAPRSASVVVIERCRLLTISSDVFRECLLDHPILALGIIRLLTKRIRVLTENVRSLALKSVSRRVVALLESIAISEGETQVIDPRPSNQEIADRIGASREMVGRILRKMEKNGHIDLGHRTAIILKSRPLAP
ncbi:MAG: Crp/Fnr family transcriptional regulator [marine bacterium B5-7]|nr:MAG: Crp/Fnr family transcriptional regulator [marine bacterium B5-7]